ncbi:MAG: HAD family hydrolase [Candidatus Paceibacterota bacterium]|jgi:FMN phosphatase YigB (HAD superfamily)
MNFDYKKNIKVIGFDLDQTLFPKSPEIDETIQEYIYRKISEQRHTTIEESKKMFKDLYKDGAGLSGSKSLEVLGVPNAKEVVQMALEKADIAKFLSPDEKTLSIVKKLKERYGNLDIITGSNLKITKEKLGHLGFDLRLFNNIFTQDDVSKSDGSAYKIWMKKYPSLKPDQFLYIGDRVMSDHMEPKKLGINSILVNQKEKNLDVDCPQLSLLVEIEKYLI